jgi:hypothetical protein
MSESMISSKIGLIYYHANAREWLKNNDKKIMVKK